MVKINWINHMYNDDVFHAVKEERNILFTIKLLINVELATLF